MNTTNKVIRVRKISKAQYEALIAAGYTVVIVGDDLQSEAL